MMEAKGGGDFDHRCQTTRVARGDTRFSPTYGVPYLVVFANDTSPRDVEAQGDEEQVYVVNERSDEGGRKGWPML